MNVQLFCVNVVTNVLNDSMSCDWVCLIVKNNIIWSKTSAEQVVNVKLTSTILLSANPYFIWAAPQLTWRLITFCYERRSFAACTIHMQEITVVWSKCCLIFYELPTESVRRCIVVVEYTHWHFNPIIRSLKFVLVEVDIKFDVKLLEVRWADIFFCRSVCNEVSYINVRNPIINLDTVIFPNKVLAVNFYTQFLKSWERTELTLEWLVRDFLIYACCQILDFTIIVPILNLIIVWHNHCRNNEAVRVTIRRSQIFLCIPSTQSYEQLFILFFFVLCLAIHKQESVLCIVAS